MSTEIQTTTPTSLAVRDTASTAAASMARAAIEARYTLAMYHPRDMDVVRMEVLRECERPVFADAARYRLEFGKEVVVGLSIRFVEQALQSMGHIHSVARTVHEDDDRRIVEVEVSDFQRGVTHSKHLTITKTVERKYAKGRVVLGKRQNSYGDTVYIVVATEAEVDIKEAAAVSKALRTCGLRLVPAWLQEEAEQKIIQTLANEAAKDPDAERRKLLDAFAAVNITGPDLARYLGVAKIATLQPKHLAELRGVYAAIRDGEATWEEIMAHRSPQAENEPSNQASAPAEMDWERYTRETAAVIERMEREDATRQEIQRLSDQLTEKARSMGAPDDWDARGGDERTDRAWAALEDSERQA